MPNDTMHLKIVIAGPIKSGKSAIANFLADESEGLKAACNYTPTLGVRIRECERSIPPGGGSKIPIELWDCSGDQNYEPCWPAVLADAHGVILVYNPEKPAQEQEVSLWYDYFVKGAGLDDDQCLLIIDRLNANGGPNARYLPPPKLSRVTVLNASYESGAVIRKGFDDFLRSLLSSAAQRKPAS